MFERLAEWYLTRRGRAVLPRRFLGLAVGCAAAVEYEPGLWTVSLPECASIVAVNNSVVQRHT